ncbi:MAG: hypothetical protein HW416_3721, partial [Chloroflexi bacterium]|nr:hypothetical protein [Chloroflexota bacterium]
ADQVLWEFENIFVLSGQTNGAWTDLTAEFKQLKSAEPGEATSRAILDRVRAFGEYCATFSAEPIKFKGEPVQADAAD